MGDNELIRVGFSRRQADAIQAEIAAGSGGGIGGTGDFGGVLRARNNAVDYTHAGSPVSHSMRPKSWVFDDYTGHGNATFALGSAADDPNAFGTNVSGWYLVRVKVWVRFSGATPDTVSLGGAGYFGDNFLLELPTGPNGGGAGSPGARVDVTWGPVWIPALGLDGDRSGYLYSRLDWVHTSEAPLELFSGNLPFEHFVALLAAT